MTEMRQRSASRAPTNEPGPRTQLQSYFCHFVSIRIQLISGFFKVTQSYRRFINKYPLPLISFPRNLQLKSLRDDLQTTTSRPAPPRQANRLANVWTDKRISTCFKGFQKDFKRNQSKSKQKNYGASSNYRPRPVPFAPCSHRYRACSRSFAPIRG
jgi:hypothetical protein